MDNDTIEGWFAPLALEALRTVPADFRAKVLDLQRKQARCRSPRPGGAARGFMESMTLPCGTDLTVEKPPMRESTSIRIVLGCHGATFTAKNLRLLDTRRPETVVMAATGRRLGDLVSLEGIMKRLEDSIILGCYEHDGHQIITLDLPDVVIRCGDVGSERRTETGHAA